MPLLDDATGATTQVLAGYPFRQGRIRERLPSGLSDGRRGHAVPIANRIFSLLFTWLLSQRFTDTLCGTKALRRAGRSYLGNFDPFGDFDLTFGASKLGLKVVEVPIRYASRIYGEIQISRFRHGF
jgi:hypothetical protein